MSKLEIKTIKEIINEFNLEYELKREKLSRTKWVSVESLKKLLKAMEDSAVLYETQDYAYGFEDACKKLLGLLEKGGEKQK